MLIYLLFIHILLIMMRNWCYFPTFTGKQKEKAKDDKASNEKSVKQSYNPSMSRYHPINDACWERGDK